MEISESAWAKAKEICTGIGADPYSKKIVCEKVARAIYQERQECAEIAYHVASDIGKEPEKAESYWTGVLDSSVRISQAIRNK